MEKLRVAIVGAGISGLTALKECLANGIDATVFESRSDIGGQWNYEEHPQPLPRLNAESCSNTQSIRLSQHSAFTTNMHEGVVLNSCRDTTHFSDFPMSPDRYPEFFGHRLFKQYIDEYTDYYGLRGYIRVNTPVLLCKVLESGQWCVTYRTAEGATANEQYDAVFACSGRVSTPLLPEFPGRERFKGEFMHSHVYRRPGRFEGKKVAVIGFGNSAADVSCEVAPQAKELHLITRRGGWVVPRYAFGKPAEAFNSRMAESVLPTKISEWGQTALLNLVMGDLPKDIQPEHTVHEANVTVRGDLLENIRVGRITVHRAEVGKMTETGLKLSNDKTLDVDVIICCTGYRINFPYLALDDVDPSGGFLELYKHIVPPRFSNLFLIGLIELPGPALPVIEAQTRWATAVVTKRITLPSQPKMDEWIEAYRQNRAAKMVHSERHLTGIIRYLPYCDDLLSELHASPSLRVLLRQVFTHSPLTWLRIMQAVYFGISSPAQYRLFGDGAKTELAKATLLRLASCGTALSAEEKAALESQE